MLSLPATLTQSQASDCLAQLTLGVGQESESQVVFDAAKLSQFDSSALAVLLALRRECAKAGKRFAVSGVPQRLRELAALYGIEGLLNAL